MIHAKISAQSMPAQNEPIPETGFTLNVCRGTTYCEHSAAPGAILVNRIGKLLQSRDLGHFLASKVNGPIKAHHRFRVSVSACPNGCSQPQIMDVGFIGACVPRFTGEDCLRCGACVEACREGAVRLSDEFPDPVIRFSECLTCGACARVCPSGCLAEGSTGWRVLLGGRLGRNPALGREIVGLHTDEEALAVLAACLDFYTSRYIPGRRFGEILETADGFGQLGQFDHPAAVRPAVVSPTTVRVDSQVELAQ